MVGTGEPPPYCNKNTLGKIESKFGIGRPPPPQLGQKTKFFLRFNLKTPLTTERRQFVTTKVLETPSRGVLVVVKHLKLLGDVRPMRRTGSP